MLVAAALVPPTALLVPGAGGRADLLGVERAAVTAAVAGLLAEGPERVVVLVPGTGTVAERSAGGLSPTLAAAGVPDGLTQPVGMGAREGPEAAEPSGEPVNDVAAAIGVWLLQRAGWEGPTSVVGASDQEEAARALGRGSRVAALLLGTGSARRGSAAALAPEPDGEQVDRAVAHWLRGGPEPDREHLDRHAVTAADPVRALRAAAGDALACTGVVDLAPLGVTYLIATWHLPGRVAADVT